MFHSVWAEINAAVPQGSVLAPLIFLTYINGLPKIHLQKLDQFGDDTSILISNKDTRYESASNVLNHLLRWFSVNGLALNFGKTNFI